jgi:hypothetical protein
MDWADHLAIGICFFRLIKCEDFFAKRSYMLKLWSNMFFFATRGNATRKFKLEMMVQCFRRHINKVLKWIIHCCGSNFVELNTPLVLSEYLADGGYEGILWQNPVKLQFPSRFCFEDIHVVKIMLLFFHIMNYTAAILMFMLWHIESWYSKNRMFDS